MRYVGLGVVVFGVSLYILGVFALPAMIGALIASGIAARRGLGQEQAFRLVAPVCVLLLLAGLVLSMVLVPTARIVRGNESLDGISGSRIWVTAPTSTLFP